MALISALNEKQLDRVLADALRQDHAFLNWFIGQTRFAGRHCRRVLVRDDHPWGAPRGEQVKFRETDILLVCEDENSVRFALHIENKGQRRGFGEDQANDYPKRAAAWMKIPKWGNYTEWECVLVAPETHKSRWAMDHAAFTSHISYETLAPTLPAFK